MLEEQLPRSKCRRMRAANVRKQMWKSLHDARLCEEKVTGKDPLVSTSALERLEAKVDILSNFVIQQLSVVIPHVRTHYDTNPDEFDSGPSNTDAANVWELLQSEFSQFDAKAQPFVSRHQSKYDRNSLLFCRQSDMNVSSEVCGLRVAPRPQGDFRSLPPSEWQVLYPRFAVDGHSMDLFPHASKFSAVDVVLFIKDFTIVIDNLLAAHNIDVAEWTAKLRRHVEEIYMDSSFSEEDLGTHEMVEKTLRDVLGVVNEWSVDEHNVQVEGDINVAAWLRNHRSPPQHVASSGLDNIEPVNTHQSVSRVQIATPAWTGLKVVRKQSSIASSATASLNRHGGAPSKKAHRKQREKPHGLERTSEGRHKAK